MKPRESIVALIFALEFFLGVPPGGTEVFTALSHVNKLVNIELELSDALDKYIKTQEQKLKDLKEFSEDLGRSMRQAAADRPKYIGHPLNTFLMIRRLVKEWPHVRRQIEAESDQEVDLADKLGHYRSAFPSNVDLKGALTAIKRLQDVYNLKASDFTQGPYGLSTKTGEPMVTALDAYHIGRIAYLEDDMPATVEWMAEALRLGNNSVLGPSLDLLTVLDHLAFAEFKTGDYENAVNHTLQMLKIDPGHQRAQDNLAYYIEQYNQNINSAEHHQPDVSSEPDYRWIGQHNPQEDLQHINWYHEREIFKKLCRGDPMPQAPQNPRRLACRYFRQHPVCTIKRCPVEVVFTDPDIMILHQVMSDSEVERVRQISEPILNRATVHNPLTGKLEFANYRISKNCWLSGEDHKVIADVERRASAMTGLNFKTAEAFQVQNYGLAGHYDPHFDFSRDMETSTLKNLGVGNRIATVLFYMSDVEAGGATVFPYIGARFLPKKGDAVFWHNLLRSGEGDFRTRHAGCPVLAGTKWVANKWIHEYGNEFTTPCTLRPDE